MTSEVKTLEQESINLNNPPEIVWVKVREALKLIWSENIKHHDIGALVKSIQLNGLQEIPKFDKMLPGIKAGNGRVEALARMERESYDLPAGIATEEGTGHWVMPLLIGTDADSYADAAAYAIDSNNMVMMGGGYSLGDIARLYDPDQYLKMVEKIDMAGGTMVSLDKEDIQALYRIVMPEENENPDPMPEVPSISAAVQADKIPEEEDHWPGIKAKIRPDLYEVYLQITGEFGDTDSERLEGLLEKYRVSIK